MALPVKEVAKCHPERRLQQVGPSARGSTKTGVAADATISNAAAIAGSTVQQTMQTKHAMQRQLKPFIKCLYTQLQL